MSKEQNGKKTGGMKYHNGFFFVGISFRNMRAHVFDTFDTKCMKQEKNGLDFFFVLLWNNF